MEPLKTGVDVGSVGATITAIMGVMNPLLEGVVLILTILWFVYRFATRKALAKQDDKE